MSQIKLHASSSSRIRNGSTKRGYVVRLEFARRPRGGAVRPYVAFGGVVAEPAREFALEAQARFRDRVVKRTVLTVDHMGRVLAEEEV